MSNELIGQDLNSTHIELIVLTDYHTLKTGGGDFVLPDSSECPQNGKCS